MKTLGLFFTKGVSVEIWKESGLLDREKLIYEELIKRKVFNKIYWFTYGSNDKKYQKDLMEEIQIIPKPKIFAGNLGNLIYSFLLPIKQKKYLKECSVYKTNQMGGSWTAVISKLLYKKPLILRTGYTYSKNDLEAKKYISYLKDRLIETIAYKFNNIVIVSSDSQKKYIQEKYKPKSIIVIPNYIDINLFKPLNKIKIKDIVFVGRLSEEKNLFNLINAIAKTPYSLDIYGQGPLKNEIETQIKKLGKEKQIKLCGVVPNCKLPKILNQYSIYVLSSLYEGMPKTLLEAMSCGLCSLGTNVSGIKEVIEHNKNGWLVNSEEESIKKGIEDLMKNSNRRSKLGNEARKLVIQNFSLEKIINKETAIYLSLKRK
jgi:glycosyltransferase involved in cell wall biosynthesis